jgi:MoxR-like ATPase
MLSRQSTAVGKAGSGSPVSAGLTASDRKKVVELASMLGRCRAQLAYLLSRVRQNRHWKDWGFASFRSYVESECELPFRTAQSLVTTYDRLSTHGVTVEQMGSLGWSKAEFAARVINETNCDAVLADLVRLSLRKMRNKYGSMATTAGIEAGRAFVKPVLPWAVVPSHKDWRLPRPPEEQFYVSAEDWEQLCYGAGNGRFILLIGPSGCGKSELCYHLAAAAGRSLVAVNCGAMSEPRSALIGVTHFDHRRGTQFIPSRFARAFQEPGSWILLDELSRAGRDAYNILLPAMDAQGYLALDESQDATVIRRASGVSFFATANLGIEYTGTEQIDRAVLDRHPIIISMDFPPPARERRLLRSRCPGLGTRDAARLVEIASQQRTLAREGEFVGSISTRALIAAGEQIAAGIAFESALKYCVLNRFSPEGGEASEQTKLLQIAQGLGDVDLDDMEDDACSKLDGLELDWGFASVLRDLHRPGPTGVVE